MQPVRGPGTPLHGDPPRGAAAGAVLGPDGEKPLTTAQRTSLERMIIKIMALSSSKAPEIWAALRHQLHISNEGELTAQHFAPAEQLLQTRLDQAQQTHGGRQLMQQLTELLPKGNNRQAVSDYIRREFGHTVLSQLEPAQLLDVVALLQNGQLNIPQPQLAAVTDRTLLPAEHHALNQQVIRLAAITGESPADIWQSVMTMMGLKAGDPIPARHFQLLIQFLQGHIALAQHATPTLAVVQSALKQPTNGDEQQAIEAYCQQHFHASPHSALTPAQVSAVMQFLFLHRLTRTQSQHQTTDTRLLQPALSPLIATELVPRTPGLTKGRWIIGAGLLAVLVLIWVLI